MNTNQVDMQDTKDAQEAKVHDTVLRTVKLTFQVAYKPGTPNGLLSDRTARVALWELLRAPVNIVSVSASHEKSTVTDDFGYEFNEVQSEIAAELLSRMFGASQAVSFDVDPSDYNAGNELMQALMEIFGDPSKENAEEV